MATQAVFESKYASPQQHSSQHPDLVLGALEEDQHRGAFGTTAASAPTACPAKAADYMEASVPVDDDSLGAAIGFSIPR